MKYENPQKGDIVARKVTPNKHGTVFTGNVDHRGKLHIEWHSPRRLQVVDLADLQLVRAAAEGGEGQ
ncbi:hypothetical protein GCM10023196_037500 [Actinoallomurus vinaceus]|uniref:Uncharacterized protein n=1 Tax=Actinoallomurus vinaceus TaxID=1080074 RepID=A0ABP8UB00_9ACTN